MKRRLVALLALLALLGVLGHLVWQSQWLANRQARPGRLVFAEVRSSEVSDLIFSTDEKLRLLRKDGRWRIIEPINVRADESVVDQLIDGLTDLEYVRILGGARREYRLEPYLEFATNRNRYALQLGARVLQGRYLAVNDQVYLVKPATFLDSQPTVEAMRNRRLSLSAPGAIEQIRISSPDFKLHLEKRDGWHVVGQAWQRIDPLKVETLITGFVTAEATNFEREIQGRDPDLNLEFITAEQQSEVFKIWFGCPVFAEVPAIDGVVELDPALVRLIPDSVSDLLDRALIKPEAHRIKRIRLSRGQATLELKRAGEGFAAKGRPVSSARLGRLLIDLRRIEGEECAGDSSGAASPLASLTIYYYSSKPAFDIRIYSNYYLALDGRTYRVRPQDFKALQTSLDALLSEAQ